MQVRHTIAMGMMFVAVAGCGDSTGVTAEDLEGTWNATQIVYTNNANSSQTVDIVEMGASFTATVAATGSVSTVFDDGQGSTDSDSGLLSTDGSTITLGGDTFQAERSGNQLTLTDPNNSYDFDGDGSDESATLVARLVRQ